MRLHYLTALLLAACTNAAIHPSAAPVRDGSPLGEASTAEAAVSSPDAETDADGEGDAEGGNEAEGGDDFEREAGPVGGPALGPCTEELRLEDCGDLRELIQPAALPPAKGNAYADSREAAVLGFFVYFDARFSANNQVRCESCHSVDHGFADGQPVPVMGVGDGVRNSPTMFNAARHEMIFWDGRVDSLWSQPLIAFEAEHEMNFTRLEVVHLLEQAFAPEYEKAFGETLDFSDASRFPPRGKPGDPAWEAMAEEDRHEINRVVANLGKALEAYMRKIATGPSPVDLYLADHFGVDAGYGEEEAAEPLSDSVLHGLTVFVNAGCTNCHSGDQLSDNELHNLGVPAAPGQQPDEGLVDAELQTLAQSPFNAQGPFFDGSEETAKVPTPVPGGFRTPSLRNLTRSAPYGHNGVFRTLEEVVDFHLQGGGQDVDTFVGEVDPELEAVELTSEDREALLDFLRALDGRYPGLPWNQWPGGNG